MTGMDAAGNQPEPSTDLHDAARDGDLVLVERLLAEGAPVDGGDEEGWTALMWGAPFRDVTEALLAAGADPNHSTPEGESALMAFARRGTPETVRMLLGAGARAEYTDDTGDNALMEAAVAGNVDTLPVLVEAGIEPNARTASGETALFGAAREGEQGAARLLLEMGVDPLIEVRSGPRAGETALGRPEGEEEPVAWALKEVERLAREKAELVAARAVTTAKITPGVIFEDCGFHPVMCTLASPEEDELQGISLIDGQIRSCSMFHCGPELLSLGQVLAIKKDFAAHLAARTAGGELPVDDDLLAAEAPDVMGLAVPVRP